MIVTQKISANVIAYNEEAVIEKCVKNLLQYVDEVIVVDQESTDKTAELARRAGATVLTDKHTGYAESSRQMACKASQHTWVLQLDADERLSRRAGAVLRDYVSIVDWHGVKGMRLEIMMVLSGEPRFRRDMKYRLFRKDAVVFDNAIHTSPEPAPWLGTYDVIEYPFPCAIVHEKTWEDVIRKELHYEQFARENGKQEINSMNVHLAQLRKGREELTDQELIAKAQWIGSLPVFKRHRLGLQVTPGLYRYFAADRHQIVDILSTDKVELSDFE